MTSAEVLRELAGPIDGQQRRVRGRRLLGRRLMFRWWYLVPLAAIWSLYEAGVGRTEVTNSRGWPEFRRFLGATVHPELSSTFLSLVVRASAITAAYAVLGTVLSVVIGAVGGVLMSDTWSARSLHLQRRRVSPIAALLRGMSACTRGIHEGVWGLLFVIVLGIDPLVAVLAIAVPYGAITAKVYADLIDGAPRAAYRALRSNGAGRLSTFAYCVIPMTARDLTSYAFYRLECSMRSSVVLGMVGAGGLGFELKQSLDSLRHGEVCTLVYAIVVLSWAADLWGSVLRRRPTRRLVNTSVGLLGAACVLSCVYLAVRPWSLWAPRARREMGFVAGHAWPPRLDGESWARLWRSGLETVSASVLAGLGAALAALAFALVAARSPGGGRLRAWTSAAARFVLVVCRAVPSTLWVLLALFVLLPGVVPVAVALGISTFGVLGRLMGEVLENADDRPYRAVRGVGGGRIAALSYTTLPAAAPKLAALSLYRWEVALRETVVVGVVSATGVGRVFDRQRAGLDYRSMLTTIIFLVAVTIAADVLGGRLRRELGNR